MNLLWRGVQARFEALTDSFNSDIAPVLFDEFADVLQYLCVLYAMVMLIGPSLMNDRAPFNLKWVMRAWNACCALFSTVGAWYSIKLLGFLLHDRSPYAIVCHFDPSVAYDGTYAFWIFAFMVSKLMEMVETVFLCLQRKELTFLHCFHHLTVTIFCWFAGRSLLPSGLIFATMNYLVHSFMYTYFFLHSCGFHIAVRPFAPLVTLAQIAQMFAGLAVCVVMAYYSYISPAGCAVSLECVRMGIAMYGSYAVLFAAFFINKHFSSRRRRKCATSNIAASKPTPISDHP